MRSSVENGHKFFRSKPSIFYIFDLPVSVFQKNTETVRNPARDGSCRNRNVNREDVFPPVFSDSRFLSEIFRIYFGFYRISIQAHQLLSISEGPTTTAHLSQQQRPCSRVRSAGHDAHLAARPAAADTRQAEPMQPSQGKKGLKGRSSVT
jgi:hypothetical protein